MRELLMPIDQTGGAWAPIEFALGLARRSGGRVIAGLPSTNCTDEQGLALPCRTMKGLSRTSVIHSGGFALAGLICGDGALTTGSTSCPGRVRPSGQVFQ